VSEEEEIRITLPRQWRETNEDAKVENIIKIVNFDEEANMVTKLRLSRIYKPLGFNLANRIEINYDVDYDGNQITVTLSKIKESWYGTGMETLATILLKEGYIEEDPWWSDPWEIDDTVKRLGVGKTCELILDCIKDVVNYYLTWEE
jgi:hypothetical protein